MTTQSLWTRNIHVTWQPSHYKHGPRRTSVSCYVRNVTQLDYKTNTAMFHAWCHAPPSPSIGPLHVDRVFSFRSKSIFTSSLSLLFLEPPQLIDDLFLRHTYTQPVFIYPCRARTLQLNVPTVPHTPVSCCAKNFSRRYSHFEKATSSFPCRTEQGIRRRQWKYEYGIGT